MCIALAQRSVRKECCFVASELNCNAVMANCCDAVVFVFGLFALELNCTAVMANVHFAACCYFGLELNCTAVMANFLFAGCCCSYGKISLC